VVIGNGRKKNTLTDILAGRDVGTLILGSTL
jgi:isopentenyl phosphate kinase